MLIEIVSVTTNTIQKGKSSYQKADVAYKRDGKLEGKGIMSFVNSEVFNAVSKAEQGKTYEVKLAKDEKGYWQWVDFKASTGVDSGSQSTGGSVAKPSVNSRGFETPDERAARQQYIV